MLLASWAFDTVSNGFRSFNVENLDSAGQGAAKLPAIKLWEWFDFARVWTRADWFECGQGRKADFKAIWPKDLKISAIKDLNRLKKYTKYQKASSMLRVGFALSKYPYFNRAYVVSSGFGCPYLYL